MILVCLSRDGQYQIEDSEGHLLLSPFYSVRDDQAVADHLARVHCGGVITVVRRFSSDDKVDAAADETRTGSVRPT